MMCFCHHYNYRDQIIWDFYTMCCCHGFSSGSCSARVLDRNALVTVLVSTVSEPKNSMGSMVEVTTDSITTISYLSASQSIEILCNFTYFLEDA